MSMGKIDEWFEKKALESLERKPWKPTRWDADPKHLKNRVRGLPITRLVMRYLGLFLVVLGGLSTTTNAVTGQIVNVGFGLIMVLVGVWVIIPVGIEYERSLIAHKRMLASSIGNGEGVSE